MDFELFNRYSAQAPADILQIFSTLPREETQSDAQRLTWKILLDPFYRETFRTFGNTRDLAEAGAFDDTLPPDYFLKHPDLTWITTPIHKLNPVSKPTSKPAVLLAAGAFSPIHQGHVTMMELAKTTAESHGWTVLGGYLSPSHDAYVDTKYQGAAAKPATQRIDYCQQFLESHPWLMVDPWEALYTPHAINLTDVILRLKAYLTRYVHPQIEVLFVYGSDNAGFSKAFVGKGYGVCVRRPGSEVKTLDLLKTLYRYQDRVMISPTDSDTISSTQIRQAQKPPTHPELPQGAIYLRDDLAQAAPFINHPTQITQQIQTALCQAAVNPVKRFKPDNLPELPKGKKLSLEPFVPADYTLRISRYFHICDTQAIPWTVQESPGHPSIAQQIDLIPPGDYTLIEDDVSQGHTLQFINSKLPASITISHTHLLISQLPTPILDVVDARDFILGASEAGLAVMLGSQQARIPYWAPYVNLSHRASVHPERAISFTLKMLDLNIQIHRELKLLVRDLPLPSQAFLLWQKASLTDPVCQWLEAERHKFQYAI